MGILIIWPTALTSWSNVLHVINYDDDDFNNKDNTYNGNNNNNNNNNSNNNNENSNNSPITILIPRIILITIVIFT